MMNRILRKLKNKRGETLVETLFAILIFTFASVTMYSMITSAVSITNQTKNAEEANQAQLIVAEQAQGEGKSASISLTLTETPVGDTEQRLGEVAVKIYGGENGELYAYYVDREGGR